MALINVYTKTARGFLEIQGNTIGIWNNGGFLAIQDKLIANPTIPSASLTAVSDWQNASSSAVLEGAPGAVVDFAVLQWTGGLAVGTANQPVTLSTLTDSIVVNPDPAMSQDTNSGLFIARAADITAFIQKNGATQYTLKGIPVGSNWSGWSITVSWLLPSEPTRLLVIDLYNELTGGSGSIQANISNFATPTTSPVKGRALLVVGSCESNESNNSVIAGPTSGSTVPLFGPNNPVNHFFGSQINFGNSYNSGNVGTINTNSTFGNNNAIQTQNPAPLSRWHYDITNVSLGTAIAPNQNQLFMQFGPGGNGWLLEQVALQVDVLAAYLEITKVVDQITATKGDVLFYTITIKNTGIIKADSVVFKDILASELSLISGSITSTVPFTGTNLTTGLTLTNSILPNGVVVITFKVKVTTGTLTQNPIPNTSIVDYSFLPAVGLNIVNESNKSNTVNTRIVGDPFDCVATAYQVAVPSPGPNSALFSINPVTGALATINSNLGGTINAIGYNPADNYIYGVFDFSDSKKGNIALIASDGTVVDLGTVPGLSGINMTIGAFDSNGYFYISNSNDNFYYTIDLKPGSPTYMQVVDPTNSFSPAIAPYYTVITPSVAQIVADWIYNPVDGLLYSFQNSFAQVVTINPLTGASALVPTNSNGNPFNYGSMFNDSSGNFYGIDRLSGSVIRWSKIGNIWNGEFFSQATPSLRQDATMCIKSTIQVDFGDAPDLSSTNSQGNYSTYLINNGPRHGIVNNLMLGTKVTAENDAYANAIANGDDLSKSTQDDGLLTLPLYTVGTTTYSLDVYYTNFTNSLANLYAWIDFNQDGVFQLEEAAPVTVLTSAVASPRKVTITFTVPTNTLVAGDKTFARLRITTDNLVNTNTLPTQEDTRSIGPASDGEVEDYLVTVDVEDYGDAPDTSSSNGTNNYSTLAANNGPHHCKRNNLKFGQFITTESDGLQNSNATGDDLIKSIQDDGVTLPLPDIISGDTTYSLDVRYFNDTGSNAFIYGWVDFNRNGIFEVNEVNELLVVPSNTANPQVATLKFNIPPGIIFTAGDTTFVRIRITNAPLKPTTSIATSEDSRSLGVAYSGEVEDYQVKVTILSVTGTVWYDTNCDGIRQSTEPLAANISVKLYSVSNTSKPIAITTTDSNGNYSFNNLPSGNYYVYIQLPDNTYKFTLIHVGNNKAIDSDIIPSSSTSDNFELNANNSIEVIDAGLCKLMNICGQAFFDCSFDGIYNFDDQPVCGIRVTLFNALGQKLQEQITDCDGVYCFTNLTNGSYIVLVSPQANFTFSTQVSNQYYGSKPNSSGTFIVTVTNNNYEEGFIGVTGDFEKGCF